MMPRKFSTPRKARVYSIDKILDSDSKPDANFYIGSTLTTMGSRMSVHKYNCNAGMKRKVYNYIRANGGWEAFKYEVYETRTVNSLKEQAQFEQEFIDILKPPLNDRRSYTTPEQKKENEKLWRLENKESLKLKQKQWYLDNFDAISARRKKYSKANKAHIKIKYKEWADKNRDHLNLYKKNYYKNNKSKFAVTDAKKFAILVKSMARVKCECGIEVAQSSLSRHKKKKNHIKLLKMTSKDKKKWFDSIVLCDCGVYMNKSAVSRHKKSAKHLNFTEDHAWKTMLD